MSRKDIFEKIKEEAEKNPMDAEISLVSDVVSWADMDAKEEKREWIWENYIAKGDISVMSAFYKAGKSTFLRCLYHSIGKEEEFVGQTTTKTKILVISEESPHLWVDYRSGFKKKDVKHVLVSARPLSASIGTKNWEKMIREVAIYCEENEIGLVVFDSISNFWQVDDENQAPQVKKALVPLWELTNKNIGVFLVHHDKKSGGKEGQSLRGSSAFGAFVDHILIFRRENGDSASRMRTLNYFGRSPDAVQNMMMEYTLSGEYKYVGDPYQYSQRAKVEKAIELFKTKKGLTRQDFTTLWNNVVGTISDSSAKRLLKKLKDAGIIKSTPIQNDLYSEKGRKPHMYELTGWIPSN